MTRFGDYLALRKEDPNESTLSAYLANITSEDWGAEFKRATIDGNYQLRKAIASLGNHGGGELFVGVEDDRRLTGTSLSVDALYSRLRQHGPRADWYTLDLSNFVVSTREVVIAGAFPRVLVVEVRAALLPGLVVEDDGTLVWYERAGRADRRLLSQEWVESVRRFARGKLLIELYRELDSAVGMMPHFTYGDAVARRYFSLPRYEAARGDGSVFSLLSASDQDLLQSSIARDGSGSSAPGLLPRFILDGARLDRQIADFRESGQREWDLGPGTELRIAREVWIKELERFRAYLESIGLLPTQPAEPR